MIGKLHVWRDEHRRHVPEKLRVGGLVSIEDLEPKSKEPSPVKTIKKVGHRHFLIIEKSICPTVGEGAEPLRENPIP
jgi:hypothetical protein